MASEETSKWIEYNYSGRVVGSRNGFIALRAAIDKVLEEKKGTEVLLPEDVESEIHSLKVPLEPVESLDEDSKLKNVELLKILLFGFLYLLWGLVLPIVGLYSLYIFISHMLSS